MQDSGRGGSPVQVFESGLVGRRAGRQMAESATDRAAAVGSLCHVSKPGAIQSAYGARHSIGGVARATSRAHGTPVYAWKRGTVVAEKP